MTPERTTSGKRIVLVLLLLLALWGAVLATLVWRGTRTPHYTRVREQAGQTSGAGE